MLTFLIMAGGKGERFFPLSTKERPKQLLKVFSDKSLIELTYERILPMVDSAKQIFVSTNELQVKALKEELKDIPEENIIIEPAFRDTASAIAYGSYIISKYYDNPTICVLASDHLISDGDNFRNTIKIATDCALNGNIVTLGIKPTYPEVGYGYIEVKETKINTPVEVLAFKEKPSYETAQKYYESGNYLWNSGMFIFNYNVIKNAFSLYSPKHLEVLSKMNISKNEGIKTAKDISSIFEEFPKISIDYAIMEHAKNLYCIPSNFDWSDVGSYKAFDDLFSHDLDGNVIRNAKTMLIDSRNNIIICDGITQKINLIGICDKIIVSTKNNLLICNKDRMQEIKKLLM